MKNKGFDKRRLEQNQNLTKQYAVSYAMLVFNHFYPEKDVSEFGYYMIELMRAIRPRFAVKEADRLLREQNGNKHKKKNKS